MTESNGIRVYIASPYTKGDVALNVRRQIEVADKLLNMGYIPFVPTLSHFWHMVCLEPYEVWLDYDLKWLPVCHVVLRLDGESSGADREVEYAMNKNIPVVWSVEELVELTDVLNFYRVEI